MRQASKGKGWTYEDSEYWNRIYSSKEEYIQEDVIDPEIEWEEEFEKRLLGHARGKEVLDAGCGRGEMTLRIAKVARRIVGIDFSKTAIRMAKANLARTGRRNATFRIADARNLPFEEESFDLLVSRRGPLTDNMATLGEAHRVLRRGGVLMELTIGERDKRNLIRIFGRGQEFDVDERVAASRERMLHEVGFRTVETKDYLGREIFATLDDLLIRLKSAPIVPDFNPRRDRVHLEHVRKKYGSTSIPADIHRVMIVATK